MEGIRAVHDKGSWGPARATKRKGADCTRPQTGGNLAQRGTRGLAGPAWRAAAWRGSRRRRAYGLLPGPALSCGA